MVSIFAVELTIFDSFTLHVVSSTENKSKFVTLRCVRASCKSEASSPQRLCKSEVTTSAHLLQSCTER
jgi:hypothetical protein